MVTLYHTQEDHYLCTAHFGSQKNSWNNDKHKISRDAKHFKSLRFVTVKSLTCRLGRCEDSFNVLGFNDVSQSHVNGERGPCN